MNNSWQLILRNEVKRLFTNFFLIITKPILNIQFSLSHTGRITANPIRYLAIESKKLLGKNKNQNCDK